MASVGESSRQAIFWHIEQFYGVKREEIPMNPIEFKKSLESLFGPGAVILERSIIAEIRSEFKIPKVDTFEQAVRGAMKGSS